MNKHDVNRKGTKDDHSFRNIYKIEISGLQGNNYDELDDNNLRVSIKSILLKVVVFLLVGVTTFFIFKEDMWSTEAWDPWALWLWAQRTDTVRVT